MSADPAMSVESLPPSLRYRRAVIQHARSHDLALTPREMQTLYLMITGRTRKQIATQLQLSLHTIDVYRRTLCEKARVRSSTCLVRHAFAAGWVVQRLGGSATTPSPP